MNSITRLNAVKNADGGEGCIKPYPFSGKDLDVFFLLISLMLSDVFLVKKVFKNWNRLVRTYDLELRVL